MYIVGRPILAAAVFQAALLLGGCGGLTRHGPVDSRLAAFIPSDAMALAGVRLDQIRATPLYHKLASENRLPKFNAFATESGVDLNRDVRELLLASDGENLLAIARGTFTGKQPPYTRNPDEAIAFPDKTTALAGPAASVRAALNQYKAGGHPPRDLLARAEALGADAQIWAVVVGWKGAAPDRLRSMGDLSNVDRMLRAVNDATMTIDLRNGIHASITGDCRAEADARNLADSLRGLTALARMAAQRKQPDLERALSAIQVNQQGGVVRVSADIPEELAEKLIK